MDEPSRRLTCDARPCAPIFSICGRRPHAISDPIVTHNIEEAVLMCDRILFLLKSGRILAEIKVTCRNRAIASIPRSPLVDDIYARMTAKYRTSPRARAYSPVRHIDGAARVSPNVQAGLMEP